MSDKKSDFYLRVTDDKMSVLLDCQVPQDDLDTLLTRLEVELISLDITDSPQRAELEQTLRAAIENGSRLKNELLMAGKDPKPPVVGKIEWAHDFFESGFAVDEETGAIDYRQRREKLSVEEGQLLARVTHPIEGQPGTDVYGKPVPSRKAKPAKLNKGMKVRVEKGEEFDSYYSEINGRVRWASNTLAVDDVYHIENNVGLETGHIKHDGAVMIEGDVLVGSHIEASGDIEVQGTVESADIIVGGNLTVHGGITGQGERQIKVGGSLFAKFILEAVIEAGEDIVVEKEIVQATLKARGSLNMPAGRLVGGIAVILGGINVRQAGSDGHVPTVLVAAEDYSIETEMSVRQAKIVSLNKNLEKIHKAVDPLMAREKLLSPQQREAATELLARSAEMEMLIDDLRTEKEDIGEDSLERAQSKICIGARVHPETTLRIKQYHLLVREEVNGPLRAGLMGKRVALLPE